MKMFQTFQDNGQTLRRPGSAALDLAYVAAGRFDGFWESGLHPWDCAAGILLIKEAGGKVTDMQGQTLDFSKTDRLATTGVVVSNGEIHDKVLEALKQHQEKQGKDAP